MNDDTISRRAAIDRINKQREHLQPDIYPQDKIGDAAYRICAEFIERLPSAQPKIEERKEESAQNVPKEDLISRNAAIDAECEVCQIAPKKERGHNCTYYVHGCKEIECLRALPSAQPVGASMHDSSTDYAHGFADGYKNGLKDAQPEPQWIPVSERLPDDLGDYLVSIKRIGWNMEEYVVNDIAYWDDLEGFHKADEVLAWMPLPEPYRAERRTDDLQ